MWKDWRDGTVWTVARSALSSKGAVPDDVHDGAHSISPAGDRIVFRGIVGGLPVNLATDCPVDRPLESLSDYELQWFLDEALALYLAGS